MVNNKPNILDQFLKTDLGKNITEMTKGAANVSTAVGNVAKASENVATSVIEKPPSILWIIIPTIITKYIFIVIFSIILKELIMPRKVIPMIILIVKIKQQLWIIKSKNKMTKTKKIVSITFIVIFSIILGYLIGKGIYALVVFVKILVLVLLPLLEL